MSIGNNIKAARSAAGLTQKELAFKCDVAEITIRQYETDKREPKYETLERIAQALGVHTVDLHLGLGTYKRIYNTNPETEKKIQNNVNFFYSIIKALESIYNRSVGVEVMEFHKDDSAVSSNYISIGEGDDKIAISNVQFDNLLDLVKNVLISAISMIGENEQEFLTEWETEPEVDHIEVEEAEFIKLAILDKNGNRHSPLE